MGMFLCVGGLSSSRTKPQGACGQPSDRASTVCCQVISSEAAGPGERLNMEVCGGEGGGGLFPTNVSWGGGGA